MRMAEMDKQAELKRLDAAHKVQQQALDAEARSEERAFDAANHATAATQSEVTTDV